MFCVFVVETMMGCWWLLWFDSFHGLPRFLLLLGVAALRSFSASFPLPFLLGDLSGKSKGLKDPWVSG